jgi:hypothetical protein
MQVKTRIAALFGLAAIFLVGLGAGQFNPSQEPCLNPQVYKNSTPISVTSATVLLAVATPSPNPNTGIVPQQKIYVCGLFVTETGSTPAIQLGYGADSCSTPTVLTGAMNAPFLEINQPGIAVPLSVATHSLPQALCLTITGGSANVQGVLSYVQQ